MAPSACLGFLEFFKRVSVQKYVRQEGSDHLGWGGGGPSPLLCVCNLLIKAGCLELQQEMPTVNSTMQLCPQGRHLRRRPPRGGEGRGPTGLRWDSGVGVPIVIGPEIQPSLSWLKKMEYCIQHSASGAIPWDRQTSTNELGITLSSKSPQLN